ncbi:WSC-domain-containing protein [Coniochaeta sp. PMI_546]|nr:WSC-domain-containing protein [Coniochaeta sp. PMI_546]
MAALRSFAATLAATALFTHVQAWHIDLPACTAPFRPFVYSGCFADNTPDATLSFHSDADRYNMTVEGCMAECKGNGFRYAGLEYYGECYCGNAVNGPSVDESQCNFPCTGNQSEVCGGGNIISIYQDTTFTTIDDTTVADYAPLGCYFDDSPIGKALSYPQDSVNGNGLTTEKCLAQCKKGGYPFAGTEYGGECWCGVVLGNNTYPVADTDCNMPCNGDSTETCGGPSRLTLYVAKDLESLEPCGYTPPVSSSSSSTESSTTSTTSSSTSSTEQSTTTTESSTSSTESFTTSTSSTTSTTSTQPPSTTTTSSSTSCTSTTTTKPTTTTIPPTTTSKPATTSTSICYTTTTVPSTCEYGCGKWCNNPLPDWDDQTSCKTSHSSCKLQVAACFKNAGWPDSMKCFDYADWCSDIKDYCSTSPSKVKNYGKSNCFSSKPPKGTPPTTKTITAPCVTTTAKTTTTSKPATSTTTKCPIPTVTNICKQPTNWIYGYDSDNPVGDIELPVVTCNDLKSDFAQNPFKLYTDSDSKKCGGYTRGQVPNACADACKAQYDQCTDTYAQGCKTPSQGSGSSNFWDSWFGKPGHRAARSELQPVGSVKKRTGYGWSDNYNGAVNKCKAQYNDCLSQNRGVNVNGKCSSFGSGW